MSADSLLETPARVLEVVDDMALVEADYRGGCGGGACASGGCGATLLAQLFSRSPRGALRVANPIGARPGERVVVGVKAGSLLAASLLVYLLPLVLLLVAAVAANRLLGGDGAAALGAGLGLGLGWLLARRVACRHGARPRILRRL
ncbi:MAG: SoxR reducing system RseC family protein [Burkholderiales bacterium]|jgi:sigma-E factor negative regulatory protein RseC|nr:SoxR reducing system RseC family protein [Burkholderiales bacterium]